MNPHKIDNPIILALDFADLDMARDMISKTRNHVGMIKIGLELFSAHGKDALALGNEFGVPIFLDLKLHDVPTTVRKTTSVLCERLSAINGDHLLSVHTAGGQLMCKAAADAAKNSNVRIAGITVLTSLSERDLHNLGCSDGRIGTRTTFSIQNALQMHENQDWRSPLVDIGIKHFVISPNQLDLAKQHFKDDLVLITPGIRSDTEMTDDHKRAKPLSFAIKHGADWVVIGRPITQSHDPALAAASLHDQVVRARG